MRSKLLSNMYVISTNLPYIIILLNEDGLTRIIYCTSTIMYKQYIHTLF